MSKLQKMDENDVKHWQTIYPAYINQALTVAEGRRVSKSIGVKNPHIMEIAQCCQMLKLRVCIEPHKGFPRDTLSKGRVRVLFKDDDGQMQHDSILTKKALLKKFCELIPKLNTRTENPDGVVEEEKSFVKDVDESTEASEASDAPATQAQPQADNQAKEGNNKNKNKKKNNKKRNKRR